MMHLCRMNWNGEPLGRSVVVVWRKQPSDRQRDRYMYIDWCTPNCCGTWRKQFIRTVNVTILLKGQSVAVRGIQARTQTRTKTNGLWRTYISLYIYTAINTLTHSHAHAGWEILEENHSSIGLRSKLLCLHIKPASSANTKGIHRRQKKKHQQAHTETK